MKKLLNHDYQKIKIKSKKGKTKKLKISYVNKIVIFLIFITLVFLFCYFYFLRGKKLKEKTIIENNHIYFDQYETDVYNEIKDKLKRTKCSIMWGNQREFINGVVRKYKPKKILEVGVAWGGSSIIILNAIKDIKDAHLYSIAIDGSETIGQCANKYFPHLSDKYTLFKGNIVPEYIETIGNNIDLALIDTTHVEPGEILEFLLVLPFLKEQAIIIFHDIDLQISRSKDEKMRDEVAPYIIFNLIRGDKFLPSGPGVLNKDIGAVILEQNQKRFIHDYCRALAGQWNYFLEEKHVTSVQNFFKKYYDDECQAILKESMNFNRVFVRLNPIHKKALFLNPKYANKAFNYSNII